MEFRAPETIANQSGAAAFDELIEAAPNQPAVFLIHTREGQPYLARTNLLRRRLKRLLREREQPSRLLNLRAVASRIEYWLTASRLEAALLSYELARRHFPDTYLKLLKLRMPAYVKVVLANQFPRTQVTTRLGSSRAFYYGPFRTAAAAELFESQFLDFFQVRRCAEDLLPSPEHPGCMYGEMNMCLRPCQEVVGEQEYGSEVRRLVEFLSSGGRTLLENVERARDRLSAEMEFEEAAREHRRLEKVHQVLKLRDDLARDIDRLCGLAVTPSITENSVELWFLWNGGWMSPRTLTYAVVEGKPVSLDRKLRDVAASLQPERRPARERQEHLALLARWYYSSWRDGEWIAFDEWKDIPYRRVVNAIHRVATGKKPAG